MRKIAFVFVFVLVVLFVGAMPAEAQYRDGVGSLIQGNLNMVHRLHGQLDRANYERQMHNLVFHNGYYGYYGNDGAFYGVADSQGRPLSRPVKIAIGAGIGAGLGYGISGNGRGAAIGGAVGGIIGLIASRDKKSDYRQSQPVAFPVPEELAPMPAETYEEPKQPQGEFQLSNRTSFFLNVYDGNEFLGRMRSGESWNVDAPQSGYRGIIQRPNERGRISVVDAEIESADNGWIFVEFRTPPQGR